LKFSVVYVVLLAGGCGRANVAQDLQAPFRIFPMESIALRNQTRPLSFTKKYSASSTEKNHPKYLPWVAAEVAKLKRCFSFEDSNSGEKGIIQQAVFGNYEHKIS